MRSFCFFCFSAIALLLFPTLSQSQPSSLPNITTDHQALLAFKDSVSDPNNLLTDSWTTSNSSSSMICTQWIGVSCGPKHQRVTALNLSGFGLIGNIPPLLGHLTFLRSLDMSLNNLTGSIPPELSGLRRLKQINLSNNQITGPVASLNISSLLEVNMRYNELSGALPSQMCSNSPLLKRVFLSGNRIEGEIPANISECTELEDLRIPDNSLTGNIPTQIWSLPKLKILSLYSNRLQGFSAQAGNILPEIEELYLNHNNLTGGIPSFIFNISSLRIMELQNNNLFGSIPTDVVYNLPHIEQLHLMYNRLTGGIPKQIGNLTSLKQLALFCNKLSGELPDELGKLSYLEFFAVSYNDLLSGPIPPSIFNISTLNTVSMQQNFFSGSIPEFPRPLDNLESLVLSLNRLTGEIPQSINNASNLVFLELNRNSLTGPIPSFANLRNLTTLRLWENNLTGLTFIDSLTNCRYLKTLEITDNQLNGTLPAASVGNLTSLVSFMASDCKIKGTIPPEIGNLENLEVLKLSNNQLTGIVPTTIGELSRLHVLRLGRNQLQGSIPRGLCRLSNLGEVYLSENTLTGTLPDCIGELKTLTNAIFYSNQLQGSIPRGLCRLSTLRDLDLSANAFTGSVPYCVGELKTLTRAVFHSNNLNSTIPSSLWSLTNLIELDLSHNFFTGQISTQIKTLKALSRLDLSNNQLSGDVPRSINWCQSLEYLNLSNNEFIGSIPESIGTNLRVLTTLDLSNNSISGIIPESLENVRGLEDFNVSYNEFEGPIPSGGPFGNFTARSFIQNSRLCGDNRFEVPPCKKIRGSKTRTGALVVKYGMPSFVSVIILVAFVLLLVRRCRSQMMKNKPPNPTELSLKTAPWRRISYIELERGTSSFSKTNLLGRGSFGTVFKATLSDGLDIAVKVFNLGLEGSSKSFDTESGIMSTIKHRNLVSVIGCCTNMEFKALILRYMENGSLEKWLHADGYRLDLMQRLNVAMDVALALEYLHHNHTFPVVHCDIKPSNVLLDEDMTAHVGDFGISKLFEDGETMIQTKTLATIGYAAPEYGLEGKVSTKGDVYSYGILLLEMFTGKRPTDDMFSAETSLREWVCESMPSEVVDPGLLSREDDQQNVSSVFELAMKCLAVSPDERLNMRQVVAALHKIKAELTAATEVNNVGMRRARS